MRFLHHVLLLIFTLPLAAQNAPVVSGHHIIDSAEPALAGMLDTADRFGRDFNPLGDLDLDGTPDFLVGARSDDDGATDAGAVYLLFMKPDGSVKNTAKISATSGGLAEAGVTLTAGQFFGYSVSCVGDLDGDGVQDIAVGARFGGSSLDGGGVFILFLNRDGTVKAAQPINRSQGNLGFTLANRDFFGESSSFMGVLNGVPTLAVSDANNDDGGLNRGALYLLRLAPDGSCLPGQTVKISSTSGGFGPGIQDGDRFSGRDVVLLGDVDGDGNPDLAVASFRADGERGALWILFLNADLTVKAKQKIGQGIGGLQATLNLEDHFGHAITAPGDLDGDGVPDLITGANQRDVGGNNVGELFFLYLNANGTVKSEARLGATNGGLPFTLPADGRFTRTLAMLGDLAGNGTRCLAVGGGAGETGSIYLLFIEPPASPMLLDDPRSLGGQVLWLDAADPDGDFTPGGTFVDGDTRWVDKSSMGNAHASQANSASRPVIVPGGWNGLSTVRFGGGDFMDVAAAARPMLRSRAGATLIVVARPTGPPGAQAHRVFMASTGADSGATRVGLSYHDNFGTLIGGFGNVSLNGRREDADAYQRMLGGTAAADSLRVHTGVYDWFNSTLQLYQDGTLVAAAETFQSPGLSSSNASLNIRIGADASLTQSRGFFTGDIAEIIIYDRVLTPPEREMLEAWLIAKWSMPALTLAHEDGQIHLSWPVSPVPWRLTDSAALEGFENVAAAPAREKNRHILSAAPASPSRFFRLERPWQHP
jgi:hypothetical protein